jgi:Tfp pilus assembly protein PilV
MKRSVFDNEKGFTILEAVFAAGILAFAILSYTMLKTSSRHSQGFAKQLSQAIQLSESQMEEFAGRAFNDPLLAATAGTAAHQYSELGIILKSGDFALGDATWTVKQGCPGGDASSKLITFKGKWNMEATPPKEYTTIRVIRDQK